MDYFFYASKNWCDLEKLSDYCVKYYNDGVAKIAFDDSNYYGFIKAIGLIEYAECHETFMAFGKDGYRYELTMCGAVKGDKLPPGFLKQIFKSQMTNYKKYIGDLNFKKNVYKKYSDNIVVKQSVGINGYDKYIYINKTDDLVIPFRFKKAKKKNQPLVVYFSGGGTLGHDNFNQFREFLFYANGKKLDKHDCNILCPQMILGVGGSTESKNREIFTDNVAVIIKKLLSDYDINSKRVYAYGTSLGAGLVWNILLSNADMFAGAVEAMGCYYGYDLLDDDKFKALSKVPIWMAHSSDDIAVDISSDDYFYDKLKSFGANVKYSRWDKYGHGMSYKFYRQESWSEWLLNNCKA